MNIVLAQFENVLGLTEAKIEPGQVTLLEGKNGVGKSAIIDGIMAAFSSKGIKGEIVTQGADKGRIFIKMNDGHKINASFSPDGKKSVTVTTPDGDKKSSPQGWLDKLFGASICNPVQFVQMTTAEKRKVLLSALPISVSQEDLQEWFGTTLPVNTDKHGFEVLADCEKVLYERRKDANGQLKSLKNELDVTAKSIPAGFDAAEWEDVDTGSLTQGLQDIGRIEAERNQTISESLRFFTESEQHSTNANNKRVKADAINEQINSLKQQAESLINDADQIDESARASADMGRKYEAEALAIVVPDKTAIEQKLADYSQAQRVLQQIANKERLECEINGAQATADELDALVDLARQKPKELLKQTSFPIEGLEFTDDGITINGLSIDSLSEGEKLLLGLAIAQETSGDLGFIVIDGAELLDPDNLCLLLEKAQADPNHNYIITRVSGSAKVNVRNDVDEVIAELKSGHEEKPEPDSQQVSMFGDDE